MQALRTIVLLTAAASLTACSDTTSDVGVQPSPTVTQLTAEARIGPQLAVGETVEHLMLTHCGAENIVLNGKWWHAVTPLYGPQGEGAGAPDGWGDPFQAGSLTLQSADTAVFEAVGTRVALKPSSTGEPVRVCR